MKTYHVSWRIDIEAESFQEAARKALEIQRDPESIATVFDVTAAGERLSHSIDLGGERPRKEGI